MGVKNEKQNPTPPTTLNRLPLFALKNLQVSCQDERKGGILCGISHFAFQESQHFSLFLSMQNRREFFKRVAFLGAAATLPFHGLFA
jgi:hypothetical protein